MPEMRSGSVNTDGDRGHLYYLVKLPQSGGSTFANAWVVEPLKPKFNNVWLTSPDHTFVHIDRLVVADHVHWSPSGVGSKCEYCDAIVSTNFSRAVCDNLVQPTQDSVWKPTVRPRVVLGGDDFRIGLHGQEYARTAEGAVFAMMDAAARALLSRGFDVLMDETATTEQTLMRYYLIDFEAEPILIETPASVCEERALANKKDFLLPVIRQLADQRDELLKDWPNAVDRVKARLLKRYPNFVVRGQE